MAADSGGVEMNFSTTKKPNELTKAERMCRGINISTLRISIEKRAKGLDMES